MLDADQKQPDWFGLLYFQPIQARCKDFNAEFRIHTGVLMKTFYLLVADKAWAKLYRSDYPPEKLTLIYHQRNLTSQTPQAHESRSSEARQENYSPGTEEEDFAKSLCKMLKLDFQAGRFDGLVVLSSADFLALIQSHLDDRCRRLMLGGIVLAPGLLTEHDLIVNFQDLVQAQMTSRLAALSVVEKKSNC